jgi:hypothetical protein
MLWKKQSNKRHRVVTTKMATMEPRGAHLHLPGVIITAKISVAAVVVIGV